MKFITILLLTLFSLALGANMKNYCRVDEKIDRICTTLYAPVCAIQKAANGEQILINKSNRCFACSDPKTQYVINSTCESIPKNALLCRPNESVNYQFCNEIYDPVCGYSDENTVCTNYPCKQTYSNRCFACLEKSVSYAIKGECPK